MRKPLIVIYVNIGSRSEVKTRTAIHQLYENLPRDLKREYHVLVFPVHDQETKVDVFYDKDITHISIDKIQEHIINTIKNEEVRY